MYGADKVHVGKRQKRSTFEIARDIAIRFNATYGETFVVPEPDIEDDSAVVPGIDGQKMSKSYGNAIEIFSDENKLRKSYEHQDRLPTPLRQPKPVKDNPTL